MLKMCLHSLNFLSTEQDWAGSFIKHFSFVLLFALSVLLGLKSFSVLEAFKNIVTLGKREKEKGKN